MVAFERSAVALAEFPFSDLTKAVERPVVILAAVRGDWLLCQITTNPEADRRAIELRDESFIAGSLLTVSYALPGKLFTADQRLLKRVVAILRPEVFNRLTDSIVQLLNEGRTN